MLLMVGGEGLTGRKVIIGRFPMRNKYHAQPVTENGIRFASTAEWRRWRELLALEQSGKITALVRQPQFDVIPAYVDARGVKYRPVRYIADFRYNDPDRGDVVEDVKGVKTAVYLLKKRLMLQVYGIKIEEIKA